MAGTFRLVAKIAVLCSRLLDRYTQGNTDNDDITHFTCHLHFPDETSHPEEGEEFIFDPAQFKANTQMRISAECRRILSSPLNKRTEAELKYAQTVLRNIRSFREYPVRMQRKIVEVGFYECYEAKRVILRQGHRATSYFFILSGAVVVMVMDENSHYTRPVAYLSRGQTFGELAIVNRTCRQSTVIAKEKVELFSISVEDYHRIFMSGGSKNIQDPDHYQFLSCLHFLKNWPVDLIAQQRENAKSKCLFLYFKRGDVLVKDSTKYRWLIIVKSGSVNVLQKVRPTVDRRYNHGETSFLASKIREREAIERMTSPASSSDTDDIYQLLFRGKYNAESTTITCTTTRDQQNNNNHQIPSENSRSVQYFKQNQCQTFVPGNKPEVVSTRSSSKDGSVSPNVDITKKNKKSEVATGSCLKINGPCNSNPGLNINTSFKRKVFDVRPKSARSNRPTSGYRESRRVSASFKRLERNNSIDVIVTEVQHLLHKENLADIQEEMIGFQQYIRTIQDDLDNGDDQKDSEQVAQEVGPGNTTTNTTTNTSTNTTNTNQPVFLHIHTLTKGQVFGLADMLFSDQPSLCVVSNGAECILLDKQFYLQHASETQITQLKSEVFPYPTERDFEERLQIHSQWQVYRKMTFSATLNGTRRRRASLTRT